MLEKPHKTILTVRPVPGLATRREAALAQKLKAYREGLSDE